MFVNMAKLFRISLKELFFCLQIISLFGTISNENVPTIYTEVGKTVRLTWVLNPPMDQNEKLTIFNNRNNKVLSFFKGEVTIYPSFDRRIKLFENTITSYVNFTLLDTRKSDAGLYYAKYTFLDFEKKGISLIILDKPKKPNIQELDSAIRHSELLLNCCSTPTSRPYDMNRKLEYQWFVDGKVLHKDERYNLNKSQLSIKPLLKEDNGKVLSCKAKDVSIWSEISPPYFITAPYLANEILLIPSDEIYWYEIEEETKKVTCFAECNPACSLSWQLHGRVLAKGKTLSLGKMEIDKSGAYNCLAENPIGKRFSYSIRLKVLNVTVNVEDVHKCNFNSSIEIQCSVDVSLKHVSFTWTRNSITSKIFPENLNETVNILSFQSCNNYQIEGIYTCYANFSFYNHDKMVTANTKLIVNGPPIFIQMFDTDVSQLFIRTINVRFEASATSKLWVKWYKNGVGISVIQNKYQTDILNNRKTDNMEKRAMLFKGREAIMTIYNFTKQDFGNYCVEVSNRQGLFKTCKLLVIGDQASVVLVLLHVYIICGVFLTIMVMLCSSIAIRVFIKRRQRIARGKILQRLKLQMENRRVEEMRHVQDRGNINEESDYISVIENVDSDLCSENSPTEEEFPSSIGVVLDQQAMEYENLPNLRQDTHSIKTSDSSYDELYDVMSQSSYINLDGKDESKEGCSSCRIQRKTDIDSSQKDTILEENEDKGTD